MASPPGPAEQLQGIVERLTYQAEDTGFAVVRLKTPRTRELVTAVGNFAHIQPGQTLTLQGTWQDHPKFGAQFQVSTYQETKPASLTGIEKYLGSGLIKGVGPATAKRIVTHFGLDTLRVLDEEIQRLREVPGLGSTKVRQIQTAWQAQKAIQGVMLFLQDHGVSPTYAVKIWQYYGDQAITRVRENPYQLATDIYGIGFATADAIARTLGIPPESEFRYRCGVLHLLRAAAEEGHCFLSLSELIRQGGEKLAQSEFTPDPQVLTDVVSAMGLTGEVVLQGGPSPWQGEFLCYLPSFYHSEKNLAEQLYRRCQAALSVDPLRLKNWLERFEAAQGITLSDQQRQAVELAAQERVLVLTGGPGVGKTFVVRTIVALWQAMGKTLALGAPTGRAAQGLSEVTRQPAQTLHRLLEFDPKTQEFQRHQHRPLEADGVVVDEASMLDLFLAYALVKAVAPVGQLLLVGDGDQLPSVGPGKVLRDLINSGQVPVVRLTQIFRQAQTSAIITAAHQVNRGVCPPLEMVSPQPHSDCLWLESQGVAALERLIIQQLPAWGFLPAQDLQVIAPMNRGELGTYNLNRFLQALLNPPSPLKPELKFPEWTLRQGDRVMQQVNDYQREVFNGDLGFISTLNPAASELTVQFGERLVPYDLTNLPQLHPAFCCTVHKAQGSEYPVVIFPLSLQHRIMLSRNLLYTGLTRARRLAILVGSAQALAIAVGQVEAQKRHTLLAHRLERLHLEGV